MSDSRPNILLIMTDQQRGDCIGLDPCSPSCLQTPNLDWIARTGTHFHRGYSECPSCIPARRCLMTGTAPAANGAVGFKSAQWHPSHTLAGELSRAGYQTEMIGKTPPNPQTKALWLRPHATGRRHPGRPQRLCRMASAIPQPQ